MPNIFPPSGPIASQPTTSQDVHSTCTTRGCGMSLNPIQIQPNDPTFRSMQSNSRFMNAMQQQAPFQNSQFPNKQFPNKQGGGIQHGSYGGVVSSPSYSTYPHSVYPRNGQVQGVQQAVPSIAPVYSHTPHSSQVAQPFQGRAYQTTYQAPYQAPNQASYQTTYQPPQYSGGVVENNSQLYTSGAHVQGLPDLAVSAPLTTTQIERFKKVGATSPEPFSGAEVKTLSSGQRTVKVVLPLNGVQWGYAKSEQGTIGNMSSLYSNSSSPTGYSIKSTPLPNGQIEHTFLLDKSIDALRFDYGGKQFVLDTTQESAVTPSSGTNQALQGKPSLSGHTESLADYADQAPQLDTMPPSSEPINSAPSERSDRSTREMNTVDKSYLTNVLQDEYGVNPEHAAGFVEMIAAKIDPNAMAKRVRQSRALQQRSVELETRAIKAEQKLEKLQQQVQQLEKRLEELQKYLT